MASCRWQVICSQLWERGNPELGPSARVVTHDDLAALGGFAGALRRHVEAQITAIVPAVSPAAGSCERPNRFSLSDSGPARRSSG